MSLFSVIRNLDSKFSWSFFSFIFGLLFGVVGIYAAFFYEKKPSLKFEILSNNSVYDIHEDISGLDILLSGTSIKKDNKTLSIVTAKLINDGGVSFIKSQYDEQDVITFHIGTGRILNLETIDTSNINLRNSSLMQISKMQNSITFSPMFLDPGDFVSFKLLVLHDKTALSFSTSGRISGIKRINIGYPYIDNLQETFFQRAFTGNVWIQLGRMVAYFFCFIIALILTVLAIVAPIIAIDSGITSRRTKNIVTTFRQAHGFSADTSAVLQLFKKVDINGIFLIHKLTSDEELRIQTYPKLYIVLPPRLSMELETGNPGTTIHLRAHSAIYYATEAKFFSTSPPYASNNTELYRQLDLLIELINEKYPKLAAEAIHEAELSIKKAKAPPAPGGMEYSSK